MSDHDYRAALDEIESDLIDRGCFTVGDRDLTADAVRSALRFMATRQERQEALEKGEAVEVRGSVVRYLMDGSVDVIPVGTEPNETERIATIRAIVPISQPPEVEADVE